MGRPANLVVNITGNASDLQRALGQADSGLAKLGSAATGAGRVFAVAWTAGAAALGTLAVQAFKTGVEYNTLQQKANAAFTTILGSADAAAVMMEDLTKFAKTSPFPKQAFIQASQQMLGFGIEASKVVPYLDAIQDAVAATGGGAQQIGEITTVLSQISAAGKITGTDLMQLAQRGINAADLIGSQMGLTGAQIKEKITDGTLDAQVALDALAAGMESRFGGAAEAVKETWAGAKDRVLGAIRDIGSALAAPFIDPSGGGIAVEWANGIADILRGLEPIITALVDRFGQSFGGSLAGISGLIDGIGAALEGVDISKIVDTIAAIGPGLGLITGGLAAFAGGAASGIPVIGGALSALSGPIGILVAAIAGLVATSPQLQQLFAGVLQSALDALAPLLPVFAGLLQTLANTFGYVLSAIAPLIPILAGALVPVITVLAGAFGRIVEAIAPLIPMLAGALSSVILALLPIITQLAATVLPLVISAITLLVPVIGEIIAAFLPLLPVISELITALFPPLAEIVMLVIAAIKPLLPIVIQLAKIFVDLIMSALKPIMPALVQLLGALMPLLTPLAQIIGLVASLLGPILDLISPILQLAGSALGGLVSIIATLLGSGIKVIAGIFQGIADAIADLVNWISKIKWPSPPAWLTSIGEAIGLATGPAPSGVSRSIGDYTQPGYSSALTRMSTPSARSSATAPQGAVINITVNAPYGGGDAIGRAIREQLVQLTRREQGIVLS